MIEVKVKMDDAKFQQKFARLRNALPEQACRELEYKMALDFLWFFKHALKVNQLGLAPINKFSMAYKKKKNQAMPESPMYGRGENDPRSYVNLITIHQTKEGTFVGPFGKTLHHGGLTIKRFAVTHATDKNFRPMRDPLGNARRMYNTTNVRNTVKMYKGAFVDLLKRIWNA